jgi:hypothetical protein
MIIKEQVTLAREGNRAESPRKVNGMSVAAEAAAVVVAAVAGGLALRLRRSPLRCVR